jgi:DNA polymerase III alpha subunit
MDNLYITYIDVSHLGLHEKEEDKYIDYLERYVQNKIGPHRLSSKLGIKYPITFCPQIITSVGTETLFDKSAVQECLERHISKIKRLSNCNASTLHSTQEHAEVRICGIVTALREIGTRQGANMGFVTVEDITGCFQAVILPNVYAKCADFLREDEPLFFKGIYENSDESKLLCNEITLLNDN